MPKVGSNNLHLNTSMYSFFPSILCVSTECIQEATSEFISFITSEAADRATSEKRKTITGDDILNALKTLGFDEMSEVLLIYLAKYREVSFIHFVKTTCQTDSAAAPSWHAVYIPENSHLRVSFIDTSHIVLHAATKQRTCT